MASADSILIIGGGPAGASAAIFLARSGFAVTVVEQHRFPREKVCGECISALGWEVLHRLDLTPLLLERGAVRFDRCCLYSHSGRRAIVPLPRPMYGISRAVLDQVLLEAAREAGAHVLQPARCEATTYPNEKPEAIIRNLMTNQVVSHTPSWLMIADGKSSLFPIRPEHSGEFGLKAHFKNVRADRNSIHLFAVNGAYGGVAAIEDGQWNIAFSVPQKRLTSDLDPLFHQLCGENQAISLAFASAVRVSE